MALLRPRPWPLSSDECYVSVDIEADGPIPGAHSMLRLGAAAFDAEGNPAPGVVLPSPAGISETSTYGWNATKDRDNQRTAETLE